jgi:hypothetical protein
MPIEEKEEDDGDDDDDTFVIYNMTCSSGCNYSLPTPDDGCGIQPTHVECLGSKINKNCLELHLVGSLKQKPKPSCNLTVIAWRQGKNPRKIRHLVYKESE